MTRRRREPSPAETMDIPALVDQRQELLEALDAQTEAAQAVLDCWERGNLAGAVCRLDGMVSAARAAIIKAKGGAS
jgi:hypothetical protein